MAKVSFRSQVEALTAAVEAMLRAQASLTPLPAPIKTGAVSVAPKAKTPKAKKYAKPIPVVSHNTEHDGYEIAFPGPVAPEVTAMLKGAGMYYNPRSHRWYLKVRTPESRPAVAATVESLAARIKAQFAA